jgi:hypothetical protein
MTMLGPQYKYEIWEPHEHDLIPEYWHGTYKLFVGWQCKLCGNCCDPNEWLMKRMLSNMGFPIDRKGMHETRF